MAGRKIEVRQVVGIAPRLIVNRGEHPSPCRIEVLGLLLDCIRETHFRDRVRNRVLRSPLLRSWRYGRAALKRRQVGDHARPLLAVRRSRAYTKSFQLFPGYQDPRMRSLELRFQMNWTGEKVGECRDLFAPCGDARKDGHENDTGDSNHQAAPVNQGDQKDETDESSSAPAISRAFRR